MSKILKNTTLSPIVLPTLGIIIPANSSYTLQTQDFLLLASTDVLTEITTFINLGSIVVNDGIDDLDAFDGLNYLRHSHFAFNLRFQAEPERMNGFASKNVQEAIEEAKSAIEGKISVLPTFLNNGNTSNKWLSLDGSMNSSDNLPAIATYNSKLAGLTFVNSNNGANTDIVFYKNGIAPANIIFTWQIRNSRYAWKTNGLDAVIFSAGDRISCFAKSVAGTGPSSVIINLFVQSTDSLATEGSNNTL